MLSKTYALSPSDQEKLVALASRHSSIRTFVDEKSQLMYVLTSTDTLAAPTRPALRFRMLRISDEAPEPLPEERERRKRLLG